MSKQQQQHHHHDDDNPDDADDNNSSSVDADAHPAALSSSGTAEYHEIQKELQQQQQEADHRDETNNSYSTIRTAGHVKDGGDGDDNGDQDATAVVHEMHLLLLYLMSNPEEFQRAAATLEQWNADYYYNDSESLYTEATSTINEQSSSQIIVNNKLHHHNNESSSATTNSTPLPYAVFCDDAEVVLPQAHTASQLFGLELATGMELEAAAGVPALSQLFLRWLGTYVLQYCCVFVCVCVVYLLWWER